MRMRSYNLCLIGFGNVGRALARLFEKKSGEMLSRYGVGWKITGVASRRMGWIASPKGLDTADLWARADRLAGAAASPVTGDSSQGLGPANVRDWLAAARADVLFEVSSVNRETGEPAIDHLRAALQAGAHAITANKGAVVHGYQELTALAAEHRKCFRFESAVMDGAPIFSLFRETLPAAQLLGFRGVLNSTTSVILAAMERGGSFEDGVRQAQALGITETDPSADVDGWDAAVKVCSLAAVLMGIPLKPDEIDREGIRNLDEAAVRAARDSGRPYRLISRGSRTGGRVVASVRPEQVRRDGEWGGLAPTSLLVHFETDTLPGLTVTLHDPVPETTAYGLLSDFLNAVRE